MTAVTQKIMNRIHRHGRGWTFTPKDFLDLAPRNNVGVALHALVKGGKIRRFARGIYDYPQSHPKLGLLSPSQDQLTDAIARATGDRKKMAVVRNPDGTHGREAITHYKALETFGVRDKGTGLPAAALIQCTLETGRTHQIRVHMSHVGASLIGDPVYGRSKGITAWGSGEGYEFAKNAARTFERQALHAAVLGFVHPITGENLRFEAPMPDDMARLLWALRRLPGDTRD